jgi:hypothetical protein
LGCHDGWSLSRQDDPRQSNVVIEDTVIYLEAIKILAGRGAGSVVVERMAVTKVVGEARGLGDAV